MATIDEIMEGKEPGSVKITTAAWDEDEDKYFIPYYKDRDGDWGGLRESGIHDVNPSADIWKIYKEPKKKVTKYLWASPGGAVSACMHVESRCQDAIRLDWSATEFEVYE